MGDLSKTIAVGGLTGLTVGVVMPRVRRAMPVKTEDGKDIFIGALAGVSLWIGATMLDGWPKLIVTTLALGAALHTGLHRVGLIQ